MTWLSAGGTLNTWCQLCREATRHIYIACFTFAQPQVALALEEARARDIAVRVLVSGFDLDLSESQGLQLERLKSCGCEARAYFERRLHAKVLMTEREIVIGSCNFTTASLANTERGVRLQELTEAELLAEKEWYEQLFEAAVPYKDGIGEVVPPSPER